MRSKYYASEKRANYSLNNPFFERQERSGRPFVDRRERVQMILLPTEAERIYRPDKVIREVEKCKIIGANEQS